MGCGSSSELQALATQDSSIWRGTLEVWLKKASIQKDLQFIGKMDPYCKLKFGKQEQTSQVNDDGGMFPTWTDKFEFKRTCEEDLVICQVWNKNLIAKDEFIGEGAFALTRIKQGGTKEEKRFPIYAKGELMGEVAVEFQFTLDEKSKQHAEVLCPNTKGKAKVRTESAVLQRDMLWFGKLSPLITVRLGDEQQSSSVNTEGDKNPKWEDVLIFDRDPTEDTFYVSCWNFNESGNNDLIGTGYFSISSILPKGVKQKKAIELYFEGNIAGNVSLDCEFISDEPEKYGPPPQQKQEQKEKPVQQQERPVQQQERPVQQQERPMQQQQQPMQQQQQPQVIIVQVQQQPQPQYYPQQQQYQPVQPFMPPQQGYGQYTYPNGDNYEGNWTNGRRDGQGKCRYTTGQQYEGQWFNDIWQGQGRLVFNDQIYDGSFMNGKKNGRGRQSWGNGQAYDGDWVDNNMHGQGTWTFPNGQSRQGEFVRGNRTRWLDEDQNSLMQGRCLAQGATLFSPNRMFSLTMGYDGRITVMSCANRMITFSLQQFLRPIAPPFFLRVESWGELVAIDASGTPYYTSGRLSGMAPFRIVVTDDGKISVFDGSNQPCWFSH